MIYFPRINNLLEDIDKSYVTVWVYRYQYEHIFSKLLILYTNMCPIKYLSNCYPIYLCADVFFLKKVKCYSTFLLKWLLLMVLNLRYSFQNFHSNQICGISEHCSILCPMTQALQFWFGGIPTKKIQKYTTGKYDLFENT